MTSLGTSPGAGLAFSWVWSPSVVFHTSPLGSSQIAALGGGRPGEAAVGESEGGALFTAGAPVVGAGARRADAGGPSLHALTRNSSSVSDAATAADRADTWIASSR